MKLEPCHGHDTRKFGKAVNDVMEGEPIEVVKLSHPSNPFLHVAFVEYESR